MVYAYVLSTNTQVSMCAILHIMCTNHGATFSKQGHSDPEINSVYLVDLAKKKYKMNDTTAL